MSLRALFARATAWTAETAAPSVRVGVAIVLAAFVVAQGPRLIHNLPKWHWEDGRHFHHNRHLYYFLSNFDTLSYAGLCLLGLLLFVIARRRERRGLEALAFLAFALALLCKEAAVVWPAILTAYGRLFDRSPAWRKYVPAWVLAALWVVCYREMVHLLYPAGTPGFAFDFAPRAVLASYGAYLLAFLNVLVPGVDPERAGWAIPPHLSALASRAPVVVAMAGLATVEVALMVAARWRPHRLGRNGRVAAFGLAWFFAGTSPFVVLAHRLFIRYTCFGHAGLAIAVGGIASAAAHWIRAGRAHRADQPGAMGAAVGA